MDLGKVEKIMQLMRNYGLHEIELKDGKDSIKLVQSAAPSFVPSSYYPPHTTQPQGSPSVGFAPQASGAAAEAAQAAQTAAATAASRAHLIEVRSPFVGTYYSCPAPGADEFVQVGQKIKKGDSLCIVEAMKLMNEIEAERNGTVVEIRIKNEQPVEFDQVLFLIEPTK